MYYLFLNNATYGPYTEQQVRQMVASGRVTTSTLVFEQGGKPQWLPAQNFPNLLKKPAGGGMAVPNPLLTSIPVTPGSVESTVWQGRPSTWTLLDRFVGWVLALVAVVAAGIFLRSRFTDEWTNLLGYATGGVALLLLLRLTWQWIQLKTTHWTLTTERIVWTKGVFSRTLQNLELYRIKDVNLRKPFLMRLVRRGYVDFATSDQSEKRDHGCIGVVARPEDVYAILRKYVERQRQLKGVREVDFWKA